MRWFLALTLTLGGCLKPLELDDTSTPGAIVETDSAALDDTGLALDDTGEEVEDDTGRGFDGDGDGYTSSQGDCNDGDADINPDAEELCDGVDNDCDGETDEPDASDVTTWYADDDGDGYGDEGDPQTSCDQPSGYVSIGGDCDDSDDAYNPEAEEDDCDDPEDYNCDGSTGDDDADGDGWPACEDCDDAEASVNPGGLELCDGLDNDCDGAADNDAADASDWYADDDADGYGQDESETYACEPPDGGLWVEQDGDCDDGDANVNPSATELCDGLDNDCDGTIDNSNAADASIWYADSDGDGFGNESLSRTSCDQPSGYVADASDCDDGDADVNPGADEYCEGSDDDCDGTIDEAGAVDTFTWYADSDGDGFGDASTALVLCDQPSGYVLDDADCDDADADVNPDAIETCDEVDQDCDGDPTGGATDTTTWYSDGDGDGFGDEDSTARSCSAPSGYVAEAGDCDDGDSAYNPGATEDDCSDPNDYNCDGVTGYADEDGDGYAACEECDDSEASVNPDATEVCDGLDNDCDGDEDDEDDDLDTSTASDWYLDGDEDGFGDGSAVVSCEAPDSYVAADGDCDDADADLNPDAGETCDGADEDCDGAVDEDATDTTIWYTDGDGDGFGDADSAREDCVALSGEIAEGGDCDDAEGGVNPDELEACDGVDQDCDGVVDEDIGGATWYADGDGDGYGDPTSTADSCEAPEGYVSDDTDCDDTDGNVYPDAPEFCDGLDTDCDDDDEDLGLVSWVSSGGDWSDLTDAFAAGVDGAPASIALSSSGELWVCEGTWYVNISVSGSEVGIYGLNGESKDKLDGGDSGRVIEVSNTASLDVADVRLQNGYSSGDGGGLYASSTALSLTDVKIQGSEAAGDGGCIYIENGTLEAEDGEFKTSTAVDGGGVYATSSTLTLGGGLKIKDNTSEDRGGGLYINQGTLEVDDVEFDDNLSDEGAGILAQSATLTIDNATIKLGDAIDGAGLYLISSSAKIDATTFDDNDVDGDGGSLYVQSSTVQIIDSIVKKSGAGGAGGGVWLESASMSLSDVDFSGNSPDDLASSSASESLGNSYTGACNDSGCSP